MHEVLERELNAWKREYWELFIALLEDRKLLKETEGLANLVNSEFTASCSTSKGYYEIRSTLQIARESTHDSLFSGKYCTAGTAQARL
jgi:hypothetical protein